VKDKGRPVVAACGRVLAVELGDYPSDNCSSGVVETLLAKLMS
jgi:hypothetical protein